MPRGHVTAHQHVDNEPRVLEAVPSAAATAKPPLAVRDESLRSQIALGWVTNLLLLAMMFIHMIFFSLITEADQHFRTLYMDPGRRGLAQFGSLIARFAVMPIYVSAVSTLRPRAFRWVAVAAAAYGFLFFLLHHLSHWYAGDRPTFNSHVLDLTMHAVGLWVLIRSVQWARMPPISSR